MFGVASRTARLLSQLLAPAQTAPLWSLAEQRRVDAARQRFRAALTSALRGIPRREVTARVEAALRTAEECGVGLRTDRRLRTLVRQVLERRNAYPVHVVTVFHGAQVKQVARNA